MSRLGRGTAVYLAFSALVTSTLTASAQSNGGDDGSAVWAVIFCFVLPTVATVATLWFTITNRRSFELGTQTTLTSEVVLQRAVQTYTMNGWQVTSHAGGMATFAKKVKVNPLIAFALFWFMIIPAIIYLVVGGRDIAATVNTQKLPGDILAVQVVGSAGGFGGKVTAKRFLTALPIPAGYSVPSEVTSPEA